MANERRGRLVEFFLNNYVGVAAIVIVLFIVVPMTKILVDFTMIINLAFSLIVMLVVIYTPRASEFQTFPRIILIQTLFSLGINISSTKLILLNDVSKTGGYSDSQSAMVQAFAKIVAGDNIVIGFIIFIIIIVVQVLVVTKGAGRVSEVAARFSLDSMSQKFFDVDNRLNAGIIDDQEAMRLKDAIRKEIDFYSNMDGASKFVSGNVKAGIFITVINLIGGIIMGMIKEMNFLTALNSYSILTIGDGLMSQLPSLIISVSTGILVTGNKSDESLSEQLKSDFSKSGVIYEIVGFVLILTGVVFAIVGQPACLWFLLPTGALILFIGVRMAGAQQREKIKQEEEKRNLEANNQKAASSPESETITMLDPLSLELGYALIPLVQKEKGAELLERIVRIRNEAKLDMGFVIPKIRIQDNMTLNPNDYSFKIKGIEAGHANIHLKSYMCMDTGAVIRKLQGEKTRDPAFGMDAIWVPEEQRSEAEEAGYVVVDPPTIIATHLTEIIRSHAAELLGRQEVASIMDTVKKNNPVLVEEVLETAKISYGTIERVLQNLLEEKVSIRNIVAILETMANYAGMTNNVWEITEKVRQALGLQICMQYANPDDKKLPVMRLSQEFTEMLANCSELPKDGSKPYVALDPPSRRQWISAVSNAYARVKEKGYQPIIICVSPVRQFVRVALEREMPGIVVLSDMEVYAAGKNISVDIIDEISSDLDLNEGMN